MFSQHDEHARRALLNQLPDGMLELDRSEHIINWNEHAARILSISQEPGTPVRWFTLLHIEDQHSGLEAWSASIKQPGTWITFQARPGSTHDDALGDVHEWRLCSVADSDHILCIVRNLQGPFKALTERKLKLRQSYENSPIMAHSINARGRLIMVSDRWLDKLEYTRDEVIGRLSSDFLTEESKRRAKLVLKDYFIHGYCHDIAYQMVTKSGKIIDVELSAIAERGDDGSFERSFAVLVDVTQRNVLIRRLEQQNDLLDAFFEAIPDGAAIATVDRTLVRTNEQMKAIFGYTERELVGSSTRIFYAADEDFIKAGEAVFNQNKETPRQVMQLQCRRKNDEQFPTELVGAPILNKQGDTTGFLGLIRDVSHIHNLQKKADHERHLTHAFFEAVPDGAFIISMRGEVMRVNHAALLLFGYDMGELMGLNVTSLSAQLSDAEHVAHVLGKVNGIIHMECTRRDGSVFPARMTGASYFDEEHEQIGFVALVRDVSDEVQRLHDIERQNSLMEAFFEAIPYAAVITNATSEVIRANTSVNKVFGYTRDEIVGQNTRLFYAESKRFEETGSQVFNRHTSSPKLRASVRLQHRSGKSFEGELIGAKILDPQGEVEGYLGLMRDITHEVESEQKLHVQNMQLEKANKDLERFAYIASHDLQEPLRKISSFISLLEEHLGEQLDETGALYFNYVSDGAERLQNLIRDLLAYSRADELPELVPCHPMEILEVSIDEYRGALDKVSAIVEIVNEAEGVLVMSHEAVLSQVYSNLLSNAAKYAHPDRPLRLTVRYQQVSETHVGVLFEDNGIGVEEKYQQRVFEIFQRLHRQNEIKGQGIGLAICKKIVERQGGTFGVLSDGMTGSTFWLTLKRAP